MKCFKIYLPEENLRNLFSSRNVAVIMQPSNTKWHAMGYEQHAYYSSDSIIEIQINRVHVAGMGEKYQ
jgi:hypothetical protein